MTRPVRESHGRKGKRRTFAGSLPFGPSTLVTPGVVILVTQRIICTPFVVGTVVLASTTQVADETHAQAEAQREQALTVAAECEGRAATVAQARPRTPNRQSIRRPRRPRRRCGLASCKAPSQR